MNLGQSREGVVHSFRTLKVKKMLPRLKDPGNILKSPIYVIVKVELPVVMSHMKFLWL
jgi:hypothetical protein